MFKLYEQQVLSYFYLMNCMNNYLFIKSFDKFVLAFQYSDYIKELLWNGMFWVRVRMRSVQIVNKLWNLWVPECNLLNARVLYHHSYVNVSLGSHRKLWIIVEKCTWAWDFSFYSSWIPRVNMISLQIFMLIASIA